jgi:hypothetical protein
MAKHLVGMAWVQGGIDLYLCERYLTPAQKEEWNLGYCASLGDREEIVWGLVRSGDEYKITCRCYRIDCPKFPRCRPDYVPGKDPLVIAPDEIPDYAAEKASEPVVWSEWEEPGDIFEQETTPEENEINEIDLRDEPDIPGLELSETQEKDDDQDTIITAGAGETMLVLAGPGTGKTYSLLRRLEYMVDKKRMVEASSILLLCFTRAAVREIRDRFLARVQSGEYSDDLARLDIRTFDSFATLVLMERQIDCTGWDYDTRIERVIDEIKRDPDILQEMKHFMVDEIQDLVGVRARLVQTILKNRPPGCGFTLLGDPQQAIYDYNVKNMPGELNSRGFRQWLREEYRDGLKEVKLTTNRRQTSRLAIFSARARSLLETEDPVKVREFVESIKAFPVEREYSNILPHGSTTEKVAILCRNNGEVLKISGDLRKRQIPHNVRRQHSRWLLPIWVADLLNGQRRILTRDELAGLDLSGWGETGDPDRLFGLLQALAGTDGPTVDMEKVRRTLTTEARLPDELYERPLPSLTVSTIHQAKGREFDRVYLLEPLDSDGADDLMEEARVYYVAVTRARNDFKRLERPKTYTWLTKRESNRWREEGKNLNGTSGLVSMEIGFEKDVDEESFVDGRLSGFDPHERQRYIREEVKEGDPVVIALIEDETEYYGIYHQNRLIGRMSDRFTSGVREVMKSTYERMRFVPFDSIYIPNRFTEVYVEQVYSVVKKPETVRVSVTEPYMSTGVWYAVSLAGMGKVHFN